MANATGDTGGGTTSSVCSISPSDEKAILGNLNNRVSDIERFLSQLVAADVHANNLAELSTDLGNVLNGTLMLPYSPNSPWAGPGGTIPVPDGYTGSVINGNVISMWNNGVFSVQMVGGASPSVEVSGSPVVTTATQGVTDYITLKINAQNYNTWQTTNNFDFSSVVVNQGTSFTWDSHTKISFPAGLYWSGGSAAIELINTGEYSISYGGGIRRVSDNQLLYYNGVGTYIYKTSGATVSETYAPGFIFYTSVPARFEMGISAGDPGGDISGWWTIAKLG